MEMRKTFLCCRTLSLDYFGIETFVSFRVCVNDEGVKLWFLPLGLHLCGGEKQNGKEQEERLLVEFLHPLVQSGEVFLHGQQILLHGLLDLCQECAVVLQ